MVHGTGFQAEGSGACAHTLLWMPLGSSPWVPWGVSVYKVPENFRSRSVQIALLPCKLAPKLSVLTAAG